MMNPRVIGLAALLAVSGSSSANEVRNLDLGAKYTTIQEALDDSDIVAGHTILVLPGDYTDAFAIDLDVTVKSTYETDPTALKETVLRHTAAAFASFDVYDGTLEGFTITGIPPYGDALGVFVAGTGTVTRNVIENVLGGGVIARDSGRVLYNVIRGNAPCGILGGASGAGISARDDVLVMGNILEDNYGLCDWNCGSPAPSPGETAGSAELRGGGPLQGGGIFAWGNTRIVSNLIRNNCALSGAGLYLWDSAVAVNNTIVRNKGEGAALVNSVTFANNIVAFNTDVGVRTLAGTPTIDNNLYWANQAGHGAVGTDAILANPLLRPDDVRLRPISPAVDAGDDSWVLPGDLDFNGRPRASGDAVDVGADEFVGHLLQAGSREDPGLDLKAPIPNPRTGEGAVTFRFSLPSDGAVTLTVHDVLGRRVAARAAEVVAAGEHALEWDPGPLAAGYYFVRMTTGSGEVASAPWIVLR